LQACLDGHRELYNAALQERRDAYERVVRRSAGYFGADRAKMPVRYGTQSAQLKEIRAANPEMARWSFSSQQATLRRLDKAFEAFFGRVRAGETPGYPVSRPPTVSTAWNGPLTATVAAGNPSPAVCTSKVLAT